jgi:hypothetical protein
MKLLNAFSLNMVASPSGTLVWSELSLDEARNALAAGFESAVGHESTAAVFASQLGLEVPATRATVFLSPGDVAVVGQYRGPRLAEGATTLPDGATIVWLRIEIQ